MGFQPVLVKIRKNKVPGKGTTLFWPKKWIELADQYKANPLAYEDTGQAGNGIIERCIGVVHDSVFTEAIQDPDIDAIDVDTANMYGRQWRPDTPVITDEPVLFAILRKVKRGEQLTADELDAIDENSPARGVVKKVFDIERHMREGS